MLNAAGGPWTAQGGARFTPHSNPRVVVLEGVVDRHEFAVHGFAGRYSVGDRLSNVAVAGSHLVVEHDGTIERMPVSGGPSEIAIAHGGISHPFRVISREERWLAGADHDASGSGDLGLPIGQIVKEMLALPLKDEVKEKWLYKNAQQLLRVN